MKNPGMMDQQVYPLDYSIKNAVKNADSSYQRLMILSNIMNLRVYIQKLFTNGLWKYRLLEWVMVPNVYGMGLFSDGGIFSTNLTCGSTFLKMMDFKRRMVQYNGWFVLAFHR